MRYFAKLDLSAYLQIQLDVASRELTTIATLFDLYRYKRLVLSLKSSSVIFKSF